MREVVLQEFISLDGFAAGPGDSVDFIPAATEGDAKFGREQVLLMDAVDTLVLGAKTYRMFAGYWPNVAEGPQKEFSDKFNGLQRLVFSGTLNSAPWGKWPDSRVVHASAADEVAKLKRESGKNILVSGSISIAQALIEADLVDEFRLVLCPVLLGEGRPLFRRSTPPRPLVSSAANVMDRGAVSLVLRRGALDA